MNINTLTRIRIFFTNKILNGAKVGKLFKPAIVFHEKIKRFSNQCIAVFLKYLTIFNIKNVANSNICRIFAPLNDHGQVFSSAKRGGSIELAYNKNGIDRCRPSVSRLTALSTCPRSWFSNGLFLLYNFNKQTNGQVDY